MGLASNQRNAPLFIDFMNLSCGEATRARNRMVIIVLHGGECESPRSCRINRHEMPIVQSIGELTLDVVLCCVAVCYLKYMDASARLASFAF